VAKTCLGRGLVKREVMKMPREELDTLGRPLPGDENRKNASDGSRRGKVLRTTAVLKDAIIYACQLAGSDGEGKDGLVGYLYHLAVTEPKVMGALLGRALPYHITGSQQVEVTYRSAEEVKADLAARGIIVDRIYN
jgi:hypothetical protein